MSYKEDRKYPMPHEKAADNFRYYNEKLKPSDKEGKVFFTFWKSFLRGDEDCIDRSRKSRYKRDQFVSLLDDIKFDFFVNLDNLTDLKMKRIIEDVLEREQNIWDTKSDLLSRTGIIELFSRFFHNTKVFGVLYLDIKCFKAVNEFLGHDLGDEYIGLVGSVIHEVIDTDNIFAARDGGDEYCVVFCGDSSEKLEKQINQFYDMVDKKIRENRSAARQGYIANSFYDMIKQELEAYYENVIVNKGKNELNIEFYCDKDGKYDSHKFCFNSRPQTEDKWYELDSTGLLKKHIRIFNRYDFESIYQKAIYSWKCYPTIYSEAEKQYIIAAKLAESNKDGGEYSVPTGDALRDIFVFKPKRETPNSEPNGDPDEAPLLTH